MNRRAAPVENMRLLTEDQLSKSSSHHKKTTNNVQDLLTSLVGCATVTEDSSHNNNTNKNNHKIILVNNNNKDAAAAMMMKPFHHGDITKTYSHQKRSKPRRQSGGPVAGITQETFHTKRPFLPRDDSVFLLKHQTTNSIPRIVPLVPATDDDDTVVVDVTANNHQQQQQQQPQEGPLSGIVRLRTHRRSKPRRMSGPAAENPTQPVLIRDDSIILMKRKLSRMVPLTYGVEVASLDDDDFANEEEVEDLEEEEEEMMKVKSNLEFAATKKQETAKDGGDKDSSSSSSRLATKKTDTRLTMRQKQQGFVRQNSLTPACA